VIEDESVIITILFHNNYDSTGQEKRGKERKGEVYREGRGEEGKEGTL
jgi:hypothetical protein